MSIGLLNQHASAFPAACCGVLRPAISGTPGLASETKTGSDHANTLFYKGNNVILLALKGLRVPILGLKNAV